MSDTDGDVMFVVPRTENYQTAFVIGVQKTDSRENVPKRDWPFSINCLDTEGNTRMQSRSPVCVKANLFSKAPKLNGMLHHRVDGRAGKRPFCGSFRWLVVMKQQ